MRILAPHHDDALLSLPATLLDRAEPIEVIVCFSDESDELTATCDALHRELRVEVTSLGLPEAVRRGVSLRQCLRPLRELREVDADPMLDDLAARLRALPDDDRLWVAPLLPTHVDHALTRAAAERARPAQLAYYEDQPYAIMHGDLRDRLRAPLRPERAAPPAPASTISSVLTRLRSFVGDKQIARLEATYAADGYAERLWFPHAQNPEPRRTSP